MNYSKEITNKIKYVEDLMNNYSEDEINEMITNIELKKGIGITGLDTLYGIEQISFFMDYVDDFKKLTKWWNFRFNIKIRYKMSDIYFNNITNEILLLVTIEIKVIVYMLDQ